MKILVVTQTVDTNDPVLGFFVRWIEEFAKHCEQVEVICLREGAHTLPTNVRVHSLGKVEGSPDAQEGSGSRLERRLEQKAEGSIIGNRIRYSFRFLSLVWRLRHEYDAVFVHMNPEYVVLGSPFWRMWGKKVALWYTHKSVDLKLRVAARLADVIFTASKESFRLRTKKLHVMGHGIDTDFFFPDPSIVRGDWVLSVGRLMPSKRHDLAVKRAVQEGKMLRIAGEGPERARLEALAHKEHAAVHFLGGITQAQLRDEYRTAAYLIHTSETGSLDKVVLEALACGLPIVTNDPALKLLETKDAHYVREHHSLVRLIPAILGALKSV